MESQGPAQNVANSALASLRDDGAFLVRHAD